jgi:rod shape-determining protein MreD
MPTPRALLAFVVVVPALLVQVTVLNRLPLPGAPPDLLLVVVVALALATDRSFGLLAGFWAGLAADLAPPANHTVGRLALVLALAGWLAGHWGEQFAEESDRSALGPVLVVALVAAAAGLLDAGVGALLGDPRITWAALVASVPAAVLYDVVLAPFVLPGVGALARRVDREGVFR